MIFAVLLRYLSSSEERPEKFRDSSPDLCNAGAVLYQLSHQVNWELVIMWNNDKPVDSGYMVHASRIQFAVFFVQL